MTRRRATDALCLALMLLIALGTGRLILTTALSVPATLAQAEALRGM